MIERALSSARQSPRICPICGLILKNITFGVGIRCTLVGGSVRLLDRNMYLLSSTIPIIVLPKKKKFKPGILIGEQKYTLFDSLRLARQFLPRASASGEPPGAINEACSRRDLNKGSQGLKRLEAFSSSCSIRPACSAVR